MYLYTTGQKAGILGSAPQVILLNEPHYSSFANRESPQLYWLSVTVVVLRRFLSSLDTHIIRIRTGQIAID